MPTPYRVHAAAGRRGVLLGRGRALVGSAHPRVLPYAVLGARVHSRRFSLDIGALLVFGNDTPLAVAPVTVWPWTSFSQVF